MSRAHGKPVFVDHETYGKHGSCAVVVGTGMKSCMSYNKFNKCLGQLPRDVQYYIIEIAFIRPLKERPCELLDHIPFAERQLIWERNPYRYNVLRIFSGMSGRCYAC